MLSFRHQQILIACKWSAGRIPVFGRDTRSTLLLSSACLLKKRPIDPVKGVQGSASPHATSTGQVMCSIIFSAVSWTELSTTLRIDRTYIPHRQKALLSAPSSTSLWTHTLLRQLQMSSHTIVRESHRALQILAKRRQVQVRHHH